MRSSHSRHPDEETGRDRCRRRSGAARGAPASGTAARSVTALTALTASLLIAACEGAEERTAFVVDSIASPAPAGSAEPNLTAGPDGFYLTWLERLGGDRHALRFSRLDPSDRSWSEPVTVMERGGLFVNWADFPSLVALEDGTLAAHWLEKSGPGAYAYDVRVAVSTDGGATWGEDIVPHTDGLEAEHGFVSLFPVDGRVGAVWLDGRETVTGGPMTLRFATLGPGGATDDVLLDADVCDCCQTGAAVTSDGPIVVYRDRTAGEVRDIHIVRRVGGQWTRSRPVHEDGWVINACPVNGPAVAASGRRVAVAWFTASPDPRVLVAFSGNGGASFAPPVRVDGGSPQGRVDVVLLEDGAALVSWLERASEGEDGAGGGAEIRFRRVASDGGMGDPERLASTSAARASGFPHMARIDDALLFAWTEDGDPPRVRTALGRLEGADADASGAASEAEATLSPEAPSYAAVTLEGDSITLASLRGAPVLLNVWATWCAPCRQEIPELQAVHEEYGPRGLRVIGVTVDSRSALPDVHAFVEELGMTYDVWWDPGQGAINAFEAVGVPLTVLIGSEGRILWRHLGVVRPGDPALREAVERAL